jgi:arginyl-tRNA synthetase
MNSYDTINEALVSICRDYDFPPAFTLDRPEDVQHGDYATNIAFALGKKLGTSRKEAAEEISQKLADVLEDMVGKIEIAGPGFINFFLKDDVRTDEAEMYAMSDIVNEITKGKVIVEYTDPNPFKLFHIGHLVPSAIGESVARIYEAEGYDVSRVCYQGDVGMHVATTLWGLKNFGEEQPKDDATLREKVAYLGRAYAYGTAALSGNESLKQEIVDLNKKVFARSDGEVNRIYDLGKKWSLEYFETLYKKLGTAFDHYIFESEVADDGVRIVKEHLGKVFEESDGAIVFKGEDIGLHTRVFVNSQGLPTYEAKELGNTYRKEELVPGAVQSIVVTAHEIDEYFKVMKAVLDKIDKPLADRLLHISHGMLRLPEGKMSSRRGNVIPAEELIDMVQERIKDRLEDMRVEGKEKAKLVNDISVAAIKFSILKSAPGKDMIFDFEKSLSFEGDSGPYLQYTHARICALLDKAQETGITMESYVIETPERELEQVIIEYTQVLENAYRDLGPHHIVQYLLSLTRAFNSMYGRQQIVDENNKEKSAYYCVLATATKNILAHGLYTLGVAAPERM